MVIPPLLELRPLTDEELIAQLRVLVQRERTLTLSVLLHLIEVERRKIPQRRYSSLFAYCTDRLGYSRSAAGRRILAARCLRDHPAVYAMLRDGRLNLTTLCLIARVLTAQNAGAILAAVAGQPQEHVERVVASFAGPRKDRDRIRPVRRRETPTPPDTKEDSANTACPNRATFGAQGTPGAGVDGAVNPAAGIHAANGAHGTAGTHDAPGIHAADGTHATAGTHDAPGIHAADGTHGTAGTHDAPGIHAADGTHGTAGTHDAGAIHGADADHVPEDHPASEKHRTTDTTAAAGANPESGGTASIHAGSSNRLDADRNNVNGKGKRPADQPFEPANLAYRIEFTVDEAFLQRLERVRSLLSRYQPGVTLPQVFDRVLSDFLSKHDPSARTARRERRAGVSISAAPGPEQAARSMSASGSPLGAARQAVDSATEGPTESGGGRNGELRATSGERPGDSGRGSQRRQRVRYIPAALRDRVWVRDGGRCTHVGPEGRCPATVGLHVDHIVPYGCGGRTELANLRLLCAMHNQLSAGNIFGSEFMDRKRQDHSRSGSSAPSSTRIGPDTPGPVQGSSQSRNGSESVTANACASAVRSPSSASPPAG